MNLNYFGTDGIRGKYGSEFVNNEVAQCLGYTIGKYLNKNNLGSKITVVIGRDTRNSGRELRSALCHGLTAQKITCKDLQVLPTPAISHAVVQTKAQMGIAITASHNPACDNGFKLLSEKGTKLTEIQEAEIEKILNEVINKPPKFVTGASLIPHVAINDYLKSLENILPEKALAGYTIVMDCANGATIETSPVLLEKLGAKVIKMGDSLDKDINDQVGSEYPDNLKKQVLEHKANIGIAHDGDGDRLVICDEKGDILIGEELLGILALHLKEKEKLNKNTLVTTIQSNSGLDHSLAKSGIAVERVNIGDRNVAEKLRLLEASLGGESSGHIIYSDIAPTGDGLIAALKLLEVLLDTKKSLSELKSSIELFPQVTKNLIVPKKLPLESLTGFQFSLKKAKEEIGSDGRILVRYSGTENKLRLLVECSSSEKAEEIIEKLTTSARTELAIKSPSA
tara:strand:- start:396 stop:1757 length:1362 start_codon:yes stop_codon:yes gene_type:complete